MVAKPKAIEQEEIKISSVVEINPRLFFVCLIKFSRLASYKERDKEQQLPHLRTFDSRPDLCNMLASG